jgi:hypothetical protein
MVDRKDPTVAQFLRPPKSIPNSEGRIQWRGPSLHARQWHCDAHIVMSNFVGENVEPCMVQLS